MSRRYTTGVVSAASINLPTGPMSFGAWVYMGSSDGSMELYFNNGFGGSTVIYTVGPEIFFETNFTNPYGDVIALNTWTHVVLTTDGDTQRSYINGVLVDARSAETAGANYNSFELGSFSGSTDVTFQDVFVYSVELTVAEIAQLMRLRQPRVQRANLYAWWPLFADQGTWDASGNSHTLSGAGDAAGSVDAPSAWGSMLFPAGAAASAGTSITASGSTQVTGAAAITKSAGLVATGSTQVTGAATITKSAVIVAAGSTQVTGAADLPSALRVANYSLGAVLHTFAGWVLPRSSVSSSDVYYCALEGPIGSFARVQLNGTTLRFEVQWPLTGGSFVHQQSISIGSWVHVGLTVGATCRAYVDGAQAASGAVNFAGAVGSWHHDFQRNGDMALRDAVIIGGSSATAEEMARFYRLRSTPTSNGSSRYFPLLEGGARLRMFGSANAAITALAVLGTVPETPENPPAAWGGPNALPALRAASAPISITATGLTQTTGAAALTASAAIVAAGSVQTTGAAAITSSKQIVATGTTQTTGAAAITSAAALVATGTTQVTGAAALTSAAAITAAGLTQVTGAASVTSGAVGQLDAAGVTRTTGAAALTASAPLTAAGSTQVTGAAAVTSSAALTAAGVVQTTGAAAVSKSAPLVAAGSTQVTGVATLSITYSITASGLTVTVGSAVFDGVTPVGGGGEDTTASRRFLGALGTRRVVRR